MKTYLAQKQSKDEIEINSLTSFYKEQSPMSFTH